MEARADGPGKCKFVISADAWRELSPQRKARCSNALSPGCYIPNFIAFPAGGPTYADVSWFARIGVSVGLLRVRYLGKWSDCYRIQSEWQLCRDMCCNNFVVAVTFTFSWLELGLSLSLSLSLQACCTSLLFPSSGLLNRLMSLLVNFRDLPYIQTSVYCRCLCFPRQRHWDTLMLFPDNIWGRIILVETSNLRPQSVSRCKTPKLNKKLDWPSLTSVHTAEPSAGQSFYIINEMEEKNNT